MRLGHEGRGIDGDTALESGSHRVHEPDQLFHIRLRFGGMPDHKIKFELGEIQGLRQIHGFQ